ncbi:DNA helicase-2/ATP-dependent DNA helicase PcrA [Taibaiella chishuiensis]|uniref:DNA 3'-5' helicase II n=2 Tax=Taibaiella chishuiensis TaxID=1434707 RepID=A0A2P8D0T2_9BACT|nr:DNA helicase-2/ATP-dependent DNA helicase PcrA [Taibaiella chishuiensis]
MNQVFDAINHNRNFLVEAGAGAGKTYTLIKALRELIKDRSKEYLRTNRQIACITYTNVAKDEIKSRTDNHPVVFSETIHAFCWHLIKDFQKDLRRLISSLGDRWTERIDEVGGVGERYVDYNLGYPKIYDTSISLHHDDVIKLMTKLMSVAKFRRIVESRFPVILIDEYQDTNKDLADAIVANFIETGTGPQVGFFGDHWQKIYGSKSCGLITATPERMTVIGKQANFRSERLIVESLNKIRPELQQHFSDPDSVGEIHIFHSNGYDGERRTGQHWNGDLPENIAHDYLETTKALLEQNGWSFGPATTKILMLTNNVLANEQGYSDLIGVFSDNDDILKKNDDYINLLSDVVEPGAEAFEAGRYGEMLKVFNIKAPKITKHTDKKVWHDDMTMLLEARQTKTIGDVIDLLKTTYKPRLSKRVYDKEVSYAAALAKPVEAREEQETELINKIKSIRDLPYEQLINAVKYIDDKTLYSTKHGVKGAEFENVLIVFGRGWNQYNWNEMLELANGGENNIPVARQGAFERNRNLFYVACSRPKKRLALLFTQELTGPAIAQLEYWFGNNIIQI